MPLLDVKDLTVTFDTPDGTVTAVDGISWSLEKGETLGVVGESGSGKSQMVFGITGLLADNGRVAGSAKLDGTELVNLPDAKMNTILANRIAMIFQDPMTSGSTRICGFRTRWPRCCSTTRACRNAPPWPKASGCWTPFASPRPRRGSRCIRTSSPAACGSG